MFRKIALLLFISCFVSSTAPACSHTDDKLTKCATAIAGDIYDFDKSHTHILFEVNHLGFSNTIGRIKDFDGYFTFDPQQAEKGLVDVTLNAASIDTSIPGLDKAIMGEKLLNTAKYPSIFFRSTQIMVTGKNTADITGNFTLLGVTKPLTLHVIYNKSGIHPYTNNYTSGFSATATIKRSDWGMNAYVPDVGDEVKIRIETEGTDPLKHPGNAKTPH